MSGGLFFALMLGLLALGVPIAVGIGFSSIIYILVTGMKPLVIMGTRMVAGMDSFPLLAITLFVMSGCLMEAYGLSEKLIKFSKVFLHRIPGSTGTVTIFACAIFAALSGSGPATVAAIGGMTLPMLERSGYKSRDALGLISVAGALGPLIPPSVTMIVYGSIMGVSFPEMFMGAIIPGVMMALFICLSNIYVCRRKGIKQESQTYTGREKWDALKGAVGVLIMPLIVLGSIYSGICSPTEASALSVVYCLLYGVFAHKFTLKGIREVLENTVRTSAMIMFIIAAANLFGQILTAAMIPQAIVSAAMTIVTNKYIFLICMTIILLIAGALLETTTATLILAPIIIPVGLALGLDPLHLAVAWCMNLVLGLCTPPFGLNIYTAAGLSRSNGFKDVVMGEAPHLVAAMAALLLVTFIPDLVLFLPNMVYGP